MNPEEAKVPNVEGDWQSIEIFLFSNGQQYSPPRKYLLRIDELNLWDATLNHLAQKHYGLKSPLIDLYTTNGHLVKGPLDLRDGQAYVAVAPPDTFVDAGYQKYLIKASRSWEKRQARKKPPECVTGDPCCLCSKRGRTCCDPDACCLCPEKENADSLEVLLSATGHPESRSAGGYYMSSAPEKPIAVDYKPISGNIDHMTCKLCGNKARPGEFGYSPVPNKQNRYEVELKAKRGTPVEYKPSTDENVARPSDYGQRPGQNTTTPDREFEARQGEHETRPNIVEVSPGEFGTILPEYGTRQGEHEIKLSVNGVRPDEFGARPAEYEIEPINHDIRPSINGARRNVFEANPSEFESRPTEYEMKPSSNGAKQSEYGTRPGEYGSRPNEYKTRSSVNGAKPSEYEKETSANGARQSEYRTRPGEYGSRPNEYKTRSSVNGAKPSEYEKETSANGARQSEYGTRPGEYGSRSNEYKTRSSVNGAKPSEHEKETSANGGKLVEYGSSQGKYDIRQNINGVRPVEFGSEPADNGTRSVEHDTIPRLNGLKQAQYETKPGEYKARLGEYELKPTVNGAQPGEYGVKYSEYDSRLNDYETNPTKNGSKPRSSFGARPDENGVRLAEYDTTPGEYGTRRAEYDTTPSENTPKLGEYVNRQGEYETKPTVNGGKPDSKYDNKPSGPSTMENEVATRSAEQENRSGGGGSNPVINGVWAGEDGDRTAGHKARPGYSGPRLSKIEPIKEAYETALRKNEKSLDGNEDKLEKDIVDKDASKKHPIRLVDENEKEKKGEFKTKDGDPKIKEHDSKNMSGGNGKNGGERRISGGEKNIKENDTVTKANELKARKIENPRRLSARGGAETDQGRKSGESTKEFEHGGKVNTQKGRETNPAGRAGGNGARLSEQRNRQGGNLARLGGRESRVGDHEARAGDIGFPPNDHDTVPEYPNSREANPGTRVSVPSARATPKDRINSRGKPGNLGLPKIGTPDTKVEEALVKLDDSAIKNREGSVTRQSRVGGTGAAGTLHIPEAQQHGRRLSLSAGRPSIEKKRLSVGQNSLLSKKPTPNSSTLRKLEDKQPLKSNRENFTKKINEPVSTIPVPASNETKKSKTLPKSQTISQRSTISITTSVASLTTNKVIVEKCINENEIVSAHSFKDPESETRSMKVDSVKRIINVIENTMEETQTELIYTEKSISVDEEVQTNRETVEQREQKGSSSSKEKFNSCTCTLCKPIPDKAAFDNDENTLSMLNKGGVVNIKLNIEVRNIVKSVYSCHKICGRSQSLTNITRSGKESQISVDNDVMVNHNSLQSLFTKQNFRGFGFEGSPNVMVVQCAGCGKPNPPRCDPPPSCCDSSKKYLILLNSVLEDKEDGCNFNPPRQPSDQKESRKRNSGIPIKRAFSETTLDTITTVTVSGVPLQRREIGKCVTNNTSCQTEESQNECMMAKCKVSKTQDSVTNCVIKKKSSCSICVGIQAVNLVPKQSSTKMDTQKCEQEYSQVRSNPCPSTPPPMCEKVQSVCSQVPPNDRPVCSQVPPPTYQKVQLVCSIVPPKPCEREQSVCSHKPPPLCEKEQSVCSQVPPPTCQKVQSVCSQTPPPTYQKVQPNCSHVPQQACQKVQPDCSHVPEQACQKAQPVCSQAPSLTYQKVQPNCSHVPQQACQKVQPNCSHPPPKYEQVRSVCSQVSSRACVEVQSKGCQPSSSNVQLQGCLSMPPCCPRPPPQCMQVQAYLQVPPVCNSETQTRWASILARRHCDGRYSFHLPPLYLLKNNYSRCQ